MRFERARQLSSLPHLRMTASVVFRALTVAAALGALPAAGQNSSPALAPATTSAQTPSKVTHHTAPRIPYKRDAESFAPPGTTSSPAAAVSSSGSATAGAGPAASAHGDPPAASAAAPKAETPQLAPAPGQSDAAIANSGKKDTVAGECADLLKLATNLKTQVDKTTKDVLSVAVVRDADQIETMARKMREDPRQH